MKIVIEEPGDGEEEQIIIKCGELSDDILRLLSNIKAQTKVMTGYDGGVIHRIAPRDIYYFDTADNKTFAYCGHAVYEIRRKLYELEEELGGGDFLRISKSAILNIKKIKSVSPAFSGRFEALLDNGEKIIISRQYVPDLKKKLKI